MNGAPDSLARSSSAWPHRAQRLGHTHRPQSDRDSGRSNCLNKNGLLHRSPGLGVGKSYTMDTTDSLDAESSSASSDEEDGSNTNADAGSETSASLGDLSEDSASEETQSASAKISRGVASAPRGFTDWGHGDSCRGCRGGGKKHTCPKTRAGSGSPAATAIETRAESGSTNDDEARANSDASGTAVQATKKRSHKKKPAPAGAGSESDGSSTTVQAKKRPASTGAESGTSGTAVQAKKKRSHKKKPEPAADGESESDGSGTSVQAKKRPAGDASSGTAVPAKKKRKKIIRLPGDRPPVKLSVAPAERCRSMAEVRRRTHSPRRLRRLFPSRACLPSLRILEGLGHSRCSAPYFLLPLAICGHSTRS